MRWTESQEAGLLETYWREGEVVCPDKACGETLQMSMVPSEDGPFSEFNLECPKCKQLVSFYPENDRMRSEYREWTEAERKELLLFASNDQAVYCPVDKAKCEVRHNAKVPNVEKLTPGLMVKCWRCWNSFVEPY